VWQLIDDKHRIGEPPLRYLATIGVEQLLWIDRVTGPRYHPQQRSLVPFWMPGCDDGRFRNVGMRDRDIL